MVSKIYVTDAKVTGNVIERGEDYIVVPILITMEDVYDYTIDGKKTGVIKRWEEISKVPNFDGTPFLEHHPIGDETEASVSQWGEIRNTQLDGGLHTVPAELKIDTTKAPEQFCKDAEAGTLQPVSWGFAAQRVLDEGIFNGKKHKFSDCNMTSLHVAYAPPPWKARCPKCATNTQSPNHDAEGECLGDEKTDQNDALSMALLPEKIDELLLLSDDFELGRKARALLAQLRASIGDEKMDAEEDVKGDQNPTGDEMKDAEKKDVLSTEKKDVQMDKSTEQDAKPAIKEPAQEKGISAEDLLAKMDAMLDKKLDVITKRVQSLEETEKERQTRQADAEVQKKALAFDAELSEAGKVENKDGKLFKAFSDADDKFTLMREMDAKGYIKKDIEPGKMQGSDALPFLGGDDAGRKSRVKKMGEMFYPNAPKKEKEVA